MEVSYSLNINPSVLLAAVQPAFKQRVYSLYREFKTTINSPVFSWNSVTRRKNGEVVGDPRNAIDLGGLLEGQKLTFISPKTALIEWEAPYTAIVFDHATQNLVEFTLSRIKE